MQPLITAQPNQFIALVGYAGAGKDVFAQHLLEAGYIRHNYGDVIKEFFDPFIRGEEYPHELQERIMLNLTSTKVDGHVFAFIENYAVPYFLAGHRLSAFSEDRNHKPYFRAILEHGGELVYDHIQSRYNRTLERLLASGLNVVNTRLCLLPEARSSSAYGHTVYLIERNNWAPASDWDAQVVTDLEDGGFIHHTIYNDATTAEGWEECSRLYVQHNILASRNKAAA